MTAHPWIDLTEPPVVVDLGRGLHGRTTPTDDFTLPRLWSLHLYSYEADLLVDGIAYAVAPGTLSLVPPATRIHYRYRGPSSHVYAHLSALSGGTAPRRDDGEARLVVTAGADLPLLTELMESALRHAVTRPERARADLWAVLLRLADLGGEAAREAVESPYRRRGGAPAAQHVAAARSFVESHLGEPFRVTDVARAVGISHHHLGRVFAQQTGDTLVHYVRRRRVERAHRLLTGTTMSVAAVAATVGIPDLQAFNKACRAVLGHSPRALRVQTQEAPRSDRPERP